MNRRRLVAAVFFSVVILAVLAVIVGAEVVSGGRTVSVLRLRVSVQQGAPFSSGDVDVVPLRVAPGQLNYESAAAVPPGARYAVALQRGDLLQPDDLISGASQVPITLDLTDPPPLQVGEALDLFTAAPGTGAELLLGHALPVQDVSGGLVTLLVPTRDELAWLEIEADNGNLRIYALASVGPAPSALAPAGVDQALCELAPMACSQLAVPTPFVPSTSTPAPGASASPAAPSTP